MIIPKAIVTPDNYEMPGGHQRPPILDEDEDDSDSDDSDPEYDVPNYSAMSPYHNNNGSVGGGGGGSGQQPLDFQSLQSAIDKFIPGCLTEDIRTDGGMDYTRVVQQKVQSLIQNKNHRRIAVVIDRRLQMQTQKNDSETDGDGDADDGDDTKSDRLYVYELPDVYGEIPHDYCVENMVNNAATYVLPRLLTVEEKDFENRKKTRNMANKKKRMRSQQNNNNNGNGV